MKEAIMIEAIRNSEFIHGVILGLATAYLLHTLIKLDRATR